MNGSRNHAINKDANALSGIVGVPAATTSSLAR